MRTEEEKKEIQKAAYDRIFRMCFNVGAPVTYEAVEDAYIGVYDDQDEVHAWYWESSGKLYHQIKGYRDELLDYVEVDFREEGVKRKQRTFHFKFKISDLYTGESELSAVDREKIMTKIAKCLSIQSNAAATEGEAIAAALMAQNLMSKHNIAFEEFKEADRGQSEEMHETIISFGKEWKFILADVVSRNYRCKNFIRGKINVVFYGHKTDVLIARKVFVYLYEVGDKLAKKKERQLRESRGTAKGVYNAYVKGFCGGVDEELTRNCVALQLVIPEDVEEEYEKYSADFGESSGYSKHITDASDYVAERDGFEDGRAAVKSQYIEGETAE